MNTKNITLQKPHLKNKIFKLFHLNEQIYTREISENAHVFPYFHLEALFSDADCSTFIGKKKWLQCFEVQLEVWSAPDLNESGVST